MRINQGSQFKIRHAFTLTEMMVATALCLFIMALISVGFGRGLDTFSKLRSVGLLQDRLRSASTVIKRDLASNHFQGPFESGFSGPRLSDQRMDRIGWRPPQGGYFYLEQGSAAPATIEGYDPERIWSTRAIDHRMSFTVQVPMGASAELFCESTRFDPALPNQNRVIYREPTSNPVRITDADVVGLLSQCNPFPRNNSLNCYSTWAELAYWLEPIAGETTPGGLQLYSLRRKSRLLMPEARDVVVENPDQYVALNPMISATPLTRPGTTFNMAGTPKPATSIPASALNLRLNSPVEAAWPNRRITFTPTIDPVSGLATGDDILLVDVLSFEIKPTWLIGPQVTGFIYAPYNPRTSFLDPLSSTTIENSDFPFDDLPPVATGWGNGQHPLGSPPLPLTGQRRIFDTWYRAGTRYEGIQTYINIPNENIDWNNQDEMSRNLIGNSAPNLPPHRLNIRAIQIKIRIWDRKTFQARQITIVQEV
ncbi:MAG: hypothetical protein R3B84_17085 [Zavarzinella sp.]